jgi:prepilin-type N-terminal cleavage/methylation domain-containing protein
MDGEIRPTKERGFSLAEMMMVMVILAIGILAVAKLFPTASRQQLKDRLRTSASYFVQEKVESLRTLVSTSADLAEGRHPSVDTNEAVGTTPGMTRYWVVSYPPPPLDNIVRIDVVVRWSTTAGPDSTVATSYLDH